jgi:hypothetical protein
MSSAVTRPKNALAETLNDFAALHQGFNFHTHQVPQSSSETVQSWATSASRRVR